MTFVKTGASQIAVNEAARKIMSMLQDYKPFTYGSNYNADHVRPFMTSVVSDWLRFERAEAIRSKKLTVVSVYRSEPRTLRSKAPSSFVGVSLLFSNGVSAQDVLWSLCGDNTDMLEVRREHLLSSIHDRVRAVMIREDTALYKYTFVHSLTGAVRSRSHGIF